jgi:lipopolysaccharide assembly outer membrane protein LptD (OstA)
MRIRNYCLSILFVCLPGFVTQNIRAQDVSITLPVDSIPADTTVAVTDTVPAKTDAVDAPIHYAAKDSMVMVMDGHNMIYMYGSGSVQYKNLDLTGEYIEVDANNDVVYATFALDSIGDEFGYPVFKEGETQYEMKKARYNFKTKKMYVTDVITQQGDGYVTAHRTKKMSNDDLYMVNAKYTTCDDHEHPHFYLNLTRGKLRPGKNVVTGPA